MNKIAIIDINSTKISLLISEYLPSGNYAIIEDLSEQVRIVEDYDGEGLLRVSRSAEAMSIIKMYKVICEVNEVEDIVIYASSSIKNLKNYRSFVDEIYNSIGLKVKILSEEEENVSLYMGIANSIDIAKGVAVSISGSSTKLVQYNRRNILNQTTIPVGTYQMSQLLENSSDTQSGCETITEAFKKELSQVEWLKEIDAEFKLIGTGNAFYNVGTLSRKIRKYPLDLVHNYNLTKSHFDNVYNLLKTLEIDKNKKIKGVSSDRADIFASGVCMIKAIMETANFEDCTISNKGIKDGQMLSIIAPFTNEKPLVDMLGFSLDNCVAFYDKDESHVKHVGDLALILFKQLKVLHKLSRNYVKILRIASLLHNSGRRISFYDNEKNSFAIILGSDVYGCTHRELVLSAFVASCQNINNFNLAEWIKYKDLFEEEDLEAMRKLAIIVKLANCLDKTKRKSVQDISCDILGDSVIMKTIVTQDASIEIKEAIKYAQDFKKVYKKSLEVL